MKTISKLAALTGVAAGAAGGAIAVYAINHKDNHRTKQEIMHDITTRLNSIPNATTIITEADLEKEVNTLITDRTNDIENMQQAIVKLIKDRLEESNAVTSKYIEDNLKSTENFFKSEITKHETVLNDQINQLSNGIVGDHDLNYYKDILDDSVDSSQFDELYNSIDSLDADLTSSITELKKDLVADKADLTTVKAGLTSLAKDTTGELAKVNTAVADVQTTLTAMITSATGANADLLKDLQSEVDANAAEIKRLLTDSSENKTSVESLKYLLDKTVEKVDGNILTIEDMKVAQSLLIESNSEIKRQIAAFTENVVKVETLGRTNTALIGTLQTKIATLETNINAMNGEIGTLSVNFNNFITRVEKNEKDIQTLFTMIKNTDGDINDHIAATLVYMVDTDKTLASLKQDAVVNTNTFDKRILISESNITNIQTSLDTIQGDVANISTEVTKIKDQIIAFDSGIKKINDTVAEILQDVDDLAKVVNDNEAKILGLEERVALLEQNGGGTGGAEIIYETASNRLHNMVNAFHFTKDIASYKQIQILYQDAPSARYGSMVLNIDQMKEVVIYAGGDRMHPNRTWYAFQVDYPNKSMRIAFYFAAGNNSWAWNYNTRGINVKQIVGIT